MALLDRIKSDALEARKAKANTAGVLVTLIGEANTKEKSFKEQRALTDDEVLAIVKKFLKNIDETLRVLTPAVAPAGEAAVNLEKLLAEKSALEVYLPVQMSEADIEAYIRAIQPEAPVLGQIMARLKAERGGQYDGALASKVAKRVLG